MVGDERARIIEAKARADADTGTYAPPEGDSKTYWGQAQDEFARRVYIDQHHKRTERIARKAAH